MKQVRDPFLFFILNIYFMKKEKIKVPDQHPPEKMKEERRPATIGTAKEAPQDRREENQTWEGKEDLSIRGRGEWKEHNDASTRGAGNLEDHDLPSKRGEGGWDGFAR